MVLLHDDIFDKYMWNCCILSIFYFAEISEAHIIGTNVILLQGVCMPLCLY